MAEILLVEDNPGDIELVTEALHGSRLVNRVTVATDGEQALRILQRQPPHETAPRPDLILLDLSLPGISGFELLTQIREDPKLHHVPVIVLTSSASEEDLLRSYDLLANCFVKKPLEAADFLNVIQSVGNFWLAIVRLPQAALVRQSA